MSGLTGPGRTRGGQVGSPRPSESRLEALFQQALGVASVTTHGFARRGLVEALHALEVPEGEGVLLSPLTCKIIPLAILAGGWRPIYSDIDPNTLNLDLPPSPSHAGAILFQHTYGLSDGASEVAEAASRLGIPVVEDCCHSLPLTREGWRPGRFGDVALFSSNLLKPLPAGAGAIACTDSPELGRRLRIGQANLRNGTFREALTALAARWADRLILWPRTYWLVYNAYHRLRGSERPVPLAKEIRREFDPTDRRLLDGEARRGARALRELNELDRHRTRLSDRYRSVVSDLEGLEHRSDVAGQPLLYFPVLVPDKQALLEEARSRGIELIAWPNRTVMSGVEDPSLLERYGYEIGSCPRAEHVAARLVGLPTHPRTSDRQFDRLINLLRQRYHG